MNKIFITFVLLFINYFLPLSASPSWHSFKEMIGREIPKNNFSIRILVDSDCTCCNINIHGGYRVYNSLKESRIDFGFFGKKKQRYSSYKWIKMG